MKTLRYCLTSLLLLMNTLMALATDDIIVNINPVQPVLPPQLGAYVSNPGAYFNVTVTNTTSKQAFIYFGMTLAKMPNTTDPLVIVPGNRMPKMPTVALASNETRQLNLTEMRQMFNHLNASDIVTRLDYSSGFESGQFGLLEEAKMTADEINSPGDRSQIALLYYQIYRKSGNTAKALAAYVDYKNWNDTVMNLEKLGDIQNVQIDELMADNTRKLNYVRKDMDRMRKQQESGWLVFTLIMVGMIVLLAFSSSMGRLPTTMFSSSPLMPPFRVRLF